MDNVPILVGLRRNSTFQQKLRKSISLFGKLLVIDAASWRLTNANQPSARFFPMRSPNPNPIDLAAAHGDPAEWVGRYGDGLFRYASGRVMNRELAEDLVQETLLSAFRHRAQFNGESAFGTWLIAILRRKIVDYYRKRSRSPDLDAEALGPAGDPFLANGKWSNSPMKWRATPKELAEDAEFWNIFHECMSGLPSHLGQAFQLRELGMTSVEDACATVGVTRRNFAVRLHRARLLLKQCLEKNWFRSERGGTA